jgi:hypothetical protein
MKTLRPFALVLIAIAPLSCSSLKSGDPPSAGSNEPAAERRTENVILITLDGLRWQEVFSGADPNLLNAKHGGVKDVEALGRDFWRETPEARRQALLPFLWDVIAKEGQVYGDQLRGSIVRVTNGRNFSYPGYQ